MYLNMKMDIQERNEVEDATIKKSMQKLLNQREIGHVHVLEVVVVVVLVTAAVMMRTRKMTIYKMMRRRIHLLRYIRKSKER